MAARLLAGGGLLGDHLLSGDGQLLLVACVDSVLAFATGTGEQVFRLQHAAPVTALCLDPRDDARLFTGCKDGQLTLWDLTTGTAAQRWPVGSPVESVVVGRSGDAAYVSCHWRQQQAGRLFAYDLAKGAAAAGGGRAKVAAARRLVASPCGQLLATVDRHTALVWQADCFPQSPLALTHTKPLTCAALSVGGDILAVGDATGRIVLWHGVRSAVEARVAAGAGANPTAEPGDASAGHNVSRATVHWHAEPVRCLAFSADGTYLLSGGHEGVLVVWDISSGRRTYLPRLGGCLRNIAPCSGDPARVAVSLEDNVVRLVDLASMYIQSSVRGICNAPAVPSASCLAVQPGTGHLALTSASGSLQFFDALRDTHVDRLQLSYMSQSRAGAAAQSGAPPLVAATHAVFSADAEVLVSVEQSRDVGGGPTAAVKFWHRSQVPSYGRSYTLAAMEGNPHSIKDSVTAIALHPDRLLVAVATGSGGIQFLEQGSGAVTAGPVQSLQGVAASALAFSPDGTVLAVGITASSPVVLLEVESQQTLAVLPPVAAQGAGSPAPLRLEFLADGLRLAAQWDSGVGLYDLPSMRLAWACQLPASLLAADPHSARLAVGTPSGSLVLLDAGGQVSGGQGLLHGLSVQAARFYSAAQAAAGEGPAATALLVLNDSRQFAAALPGAAPRTPDRVAQQNGVPGKQAAPKPASAVALGAGGRQVSASVAAGLEQAASHLLAPASELCPLALERLLLS